MSTLEVQIRQLEETAFYGVWGNTNDKTVSKDIPHLSSEYHRITKTKSGSVLPFAVLSRNYDPSTHDCELFIGGTQPHECLEKLLLPHGEYAVMTVKPKLGILWGASVGKAKRFFYTEWLPKSGYGAQNLEYELHTEKTVGKHPSLELIFAITQRQR